MSEVIKINRIRSRQWGLLRQKTIQIFGILALVPVYAALFNQPFAISLFTRILVFAIAAQSLNLILGYGGIVTLGHAAFIGIGAYTVGILSFHGITSALIQWPLAIGFSALFALLTGAVCLRTKGVYFIMITFAFAQMLYYAGNSLALYGGDDGLTIRQRSEIFGISLGQDILLYYLCWGCVLGVFLLVRRVVGSRFGRVLRGCKDNEARMRAMGFATYRYQLVAYVIAGAIAGLAGVLLANQTGFVSPAYMAWTRSGNLTIMVVLGGIPSMLGPIIGAATFLLLEYGLSTFVRYWHLYFGVLLMAVVMVGKAGILGFLGGEDDGDF